MAIDIQLTKRVITDRMIYSKLNYCLHIVNIAKICSFLKFNFITNTSQEPSSSS